MAKQKISGLDGLKNLVYSTSSDTMKEIENSRQPLEPETPNPSHQNLRIWIEKNHRGGKVVTIVKGFEGNEQDLKSLGKILKNLCGTGGSEKDGEIILQGHQADKVMKFLLDNGYKAKRAGG